jgi:hypothetical protein
VNLLDPEWTRGALWESESASGTTTRDALAFQTDLYRFTECAGEFVDLTDVPNDLPPRIAC